ncbi:uncharacterized protein RAG0_14114 [Rhynchosporium agropyri]|uniref:Uncharacterized protein n=1 Tax=Rhynchosporium agropyri TaxID=914238 RepID=A0A1E1LFL9_9HELO|nr:uncharacterized protein RAG0_14114 [Rhynchosporium agropyri]
MYSTTRCAFPPIVLTLFWYQNPSSTHYWVVLLVFWCQDGFGAKNYAESYLTKRSKDPSKYEA